MENAVRCRLARLRVRRGHRRVERQLDHVLGHGAVQHARRDGRVRELPPLADRPGQHGRTRTDHVVRLGLRRAARGPGRLRLSVGSGGADPDLPRYLRPECDTRRRDCQQRAGVLRRPRRAGDRARGRDRLPAARAVGLGRDDRRGAGAAAAVGVVVSGLGQGGHEGRLAAGGGRLARLYRRAVPGGEVSRALSAGCDRLDRLLHRVAVVAESVAAEERVGLRRRADRCHHRETDTRARPYHRRGAAELAALRRAAHRGGGLDGAVVTAAESQLVQNTSRGLLGARAVLSGTEGQRQRGLQLHALRRRHRDPGLVDHRGAAAARNGQAEGCADR